ncbi:Acetyltransferase (GNAT) domain-containing protein [Paenimyroides aquimaris]|uniref:Acetyltransferase (GNAT) domain-containing protein n=2 Tax=Paenimyroides marinum TaxID=1159016 RepID=A0A1H6K5C1_9FLAO|nr:Acetyltransferase (GNAT) domain-containing protein [Paenimyroides aquimaris]
MTKDISLKVVRYENRYKNDWDKFVNEAKNSTFLFRRDFMEYHKDRFEDFSLLLFKNDKLIAVFPANIRNNEVFSHEGLSYGGFIIKSKLSLIDFFNVVKHSLYFYHQSKIKYVHLKLLPDFYNLDRSHEMQYALFLLKAELVRKDAYYMLPSDEFSLNRNRKRALKKAHQYNFDITTEGSLEVFWDTLLIPNLQKRFEAMPVHTKEEIEKLKQLFPDNIKFYSVYENDKIKAGVVMFISKRVAHFQYSSGDEHRDSGALDLLFTHIMKKYQTKPFISLGSSSEKNGLVINKGLMYWKESFGARMVSQDFYRVQTGNYSYLENIFR